jgi:hypothetical protein
MQVDGAIVREQGVTFGIVIVRESAMHHPQETREAFQGLFRGMSLVLASQDSRGVFSYQGRRDLVNFLVSIDPRRIPWKTYSVS